MLYSALFANIRIGWKALRGTNTLAYYELSQIDCKKFNNIRPWFPVNSSRCSLIFAGKAGAYPSVVL